MTYPYVESKYRYGPRKVTLALLYHMAEGGNTVGYLSKAGGVDTGVSVHFVIRYSGEIVQMLPLGDVSGGVDPRQIRTDNESFKINGLSVTYGITVARQVLGRWASDPNNAIIQVEIEGFARIGPNRKQVEAMKLLTKDVLTTYPTIKGVIAHRDLQNEKACPGRLIPWDAIGGHGKLSYESPLEEDMKITAQVNERWHPSVTNGISNGVLRVTPVRSATIAKRILEADSIDTVAEVRTIAGNDGDWRLVKTNDRSVLYALRSDWVSEGPV